MSTKGGPRERSVWCGLGAPRSCLVLVGKCAWCCAEDAHAAVKADGCYFWCVGYRDEVPMHRGRRGARSCCELVAHMWRRDRCEGLNRVPFGTVPRVRCVCW